MPIPDFQSVMRPILLAVAVADGVPLALSELREQIANAFQLSEEARNERLPSGKQTVINNRVGWARTYLNKAGLLCIPDRGLVQITERGREVLASGPERITVSWLKRYPEFADFHSPSDSAATEEPEVLGVDITPDEQLASAHQS